MGLFDHIHIFQECPNCGWGVTFGAQTKDLDCSMFEYRALPEDWETSGEKSKRERLPVTPRFPLDKSAHVWQSQAERTEAAATIPEIYWKLRWVDVIARCPHCRVQFEGRIAVRDGKLRGTMANCKR